MSKIACRPRCLGGCAEHQGNDPRTGLLPLSLPAPCVPDCDIYGFHKQRCSQGGVRESWSCLPLTVLDCLPDSPAVSGGMEPFPIFSAVLLYIAISRLHKALQKGGVPAAPSGTATLLRLSPNHQSYPRPTLAVTAFRYPRLSWLDGRCVQGPGTYSPRHG